MIFEFEQSKILFQFHKGTIKTSNYPLFSTLNLSNFNSIKVRLKLILQMQNNILMKFQFHKGTIKTHILEFTDDVA